MSRPAYRWNSLHIFLPSTLRRLTIESDTCYFVPFPKVCQSLCRGLELYLKQVESEPAARRIHFRDVVILRIIKLPQGLFVLELDAEICSSHSTESQRLLWRRLKESRDISHAAVEQCFRDIIEDGVVRVGVLSSNPLSERTRTGQDVTKTCDSLSRCRSRRQARQCV